MKLDYWKVRSMSITKMVKNSVRTGDTENIVAVRYWKGISVWWGVHRIVIVLKGGEVDLTCSR